MRDRRDWLLFMVAVTLAAVSIRVAGRPPVSVPLPDLVAYVSSGIVIAVAVFATSCAEGSSALVIAATALAVEFCSAIYAVRPALFLPSPRFWYLSRVTAPALLWLAGCLLLIGVRRRTIRGGGELVLVIFILALGFNARWQALETVWGAPLSPDAQTVALIVRSMTGLFDTQVREPAWPWALWAARKIWPTDQAAGLAFSLVTSMGLLAVSYAFARKYARRLLPAILTLTLLARHQELILSSVAAHRTELYAIALVSVAFFAFCEPMSRRPRTIGLSGTLSLTLLTQTAGGIPATAATCLSFLRRRLSLRQIAVVLAISAASITPYAVANLDRFGQAFYFARTLVPTFYRNYEFMIVRGTGCDGCPTPAQMAVSSYSGRPATMGEYLFKLHTPREVFSRIADGYLQVFVKPTLYLQRILGGPSRVSQVLYAFYLVGSVAALLSWRRDLLLIPWLSLNLLAFVVPLGIDPRLLLHLAPFALLLTCLAPYAVYEILWRGRARSGGPVRVLRIISRLNVGGPARQAVILNARLQKRGFDTLLVHGTLGPGEASFDHLVARYRIPAQRIPALGRRFHPLDDIRAFLELWKVMRDFKPDIVHTHTAKAGALGRLAAALHNALGPSDARIIIVHTFHGHVLEGYFNPIGTRLARVAERLLSWMTDCTIAISDLQRNDLVDRFRVSDRSRTVVVPLGLELGDLLALTPQAREREHADAGYQDAFVVGYVGRLVPIKNLPLLVDAIRIVKQDVAGVRLVITGDGGERVRLEKHAHAAGIADVVSITGWREDLVGIYAPLDVVALTSKNEGTPVALIEAMAAGVPVVATAVGGVPDVIADGETGLLTSQTAPAVAAALLAIERDRAGAAGRAERAREHVRAAHSDLALVDRIVALYGQLRAECPAATGEDHARLHEPA